MKIEITIRLDGSDIKSFLESAITDRLDNEDQPLGSDECIVVSLYTGSGGPEGRVEFETLFGVAYVKKIELTPPRAIEPPVEEEKEEEPL